MLVGKIYKSSLMVDAFFRVDGIDKKRISGFWGTLGEGGSIRWMVPATIQISNLSLWTEFIPSGKETSKPTKGK